MLKSVGSYGGVAAALPRGRLAGRRGHCAAGVNRLCGIKARAFPIDGR
jgi:hypothetical protein